MTKEPIAIMSGVVAVIYASILAAQGFGVIDWSADQVSLLMGVVFAAAAVFGYGTPGSARLPFPTARDEVTSRATIEQADAETGNPHDDGD